MTPQSLVVSLGAFVALCFATSVFAYVSPGAPLGYMSDFAGLLSSEASARFEERLRAFDEKTGVEVAVATIPTLSGTDIETYATTLFREWGIGESETNRGLLILIARDDREMRIEVGYGLEGEITDLASARIIRDVLVPAFQDGAYDRGIDEALVEIMSLVETGVSTIPETETQAFSDIDYASLLFVLYLLVSWFLSIMSRTKEWWLGGIFGFAVSGALGYFFGNSVFVYSVLPLVLIGLSIDYLVSHAYQRAKAMGEMPPWWTGGNWSAGGGSGRSGGFGGFGGGSSGGGGASGRW